MFALLVDASEDTEGKLEPGEGSLDTGTLEEETATVGMDDVDDVDAAEETAKVGVYDVDAAEETATVGVDDVDAAEETATVGVDDVDAAEETATVDVDAAEETTTVGVDAAEASDRACLARFLAAAFVCQPHEHEPDLSAEKNDPCRHFLIEAIAAKTSLLEGVWPLPLKAGRPSARSINCSAYCPTPRKW